MKDRTGQVLSGSISKLPGTERLALTPTRPPWSQHLSRPPRSAIASAPILTRPAPHVSPCTFKGHEKYLTMDRAPVWPETQMPMGPSTHSHVQKNLHPCQSYGPLLKRDFGHPQWPTLKVSGSAGVCDGGTWKEQGQRQQNERDWADACGIFGSVRTSSPRGAWAVRYDFTVFLCLKTTGMEKKGVHPRGCGFTMEVETWVGLTGGGRSQRGGFHGSKLWLWDRCRRRRFCLLR